MIVLFWRYCLRILGIFAATGLLIYVSRSSSFQEWRSQVVTSATPFLSRISRTIVEMRMWLGGGELERIRALENERGRLLAEIARRDSLKSENDILRKALELQREGETGVLPALIIGFFREGRDEFLLLNRGTKDGVSVGDIVVGVNGALGGTVSDVGVRFSRVLMLTSPSKSVDIVFPRNNLRALARGNNSRELVVDLLPPDSDIVSGDIFVASPRTSGGRRSLLVGEVRDVLRAQHEVFPSIRAIHLFNPSDDEVLILLAP